MALTLTSRHYVPKAPVHLRKAAAAEDKNRKRRKKKRGAKAAPLKSQFSNLNSVFHFRNTNKYSCAISKKLYFTLFVFQ